MTATDTHLAIEAVWRIEAPRLIAGLARITRDIGLAEDLAQDALVAALEQWPRDGVPDNPGAWLTATARHRAVDLVRRRENYARKLQEIGPPYFGLFFVAPFEMWRIPSACQIKFRRPTGGIAPDDP